LLGKRILLDKPMCDKITTEFFTLRRMKQYQVWRVPNSAAFYNPAVGVRILNNPGIVKSISDIAGVELIPSYCYGRLYTKGDKLEKHTDRKASEYAVSITTGTSGGDWPLWIEDGDDVEVITKLGECVVYKGHEIVHWRDELEFDWCTQLLLFYVDKNGKFKDLAHEDKHRNFIPSRH
tara:strand:- start:41 stop:574 length:534 start_codon:yes stop_codon:yes gene_type:complete